MVVNSLNCCPPCNFQETVPLGLDVISNFLVALTPNNLKIEMIWKIFQILEKTKFQFEHAKAMLFAEIILGFSDVAGEVMRFVTNMVSKGNHSYNIPSRNFLQQMYLAFIKIAPNVSKEVSKKTWQLKGSMIKV